MELSHANDIGNPGSNRLETFLALPLTFPGARDERERFENKSGLHGLRSEPSRRRQLVFPQANR
jgi:hypothetical protein